MAGFTFGAPAAGGAPAPAAGGFSFGAPAPAAAPAAAPAGGGFSFGGAAPAAAKPAAAPAFSFGAPAPAAAAAATPAAAPAAAPAAPAFSFGAAAPAATPAAAPAAGGFSFGGAPAAASKPAASAPAAPAFGFGAAAPAAAKPEAKAPAAPAFSFGAPAAKDDAKKATETKAPAAPAFSFGAPAAKEAEEKKSTGTSFGAAPAPAPDAGGKAPAAATPTGASTTGGFSFGASTPAPTTPAGVATPAAPAPVATPKPGVATPAAATPAPTAPLEPPPLEYQTLTVEEILNKFQKQLEQDALAFCEEAKRVCEYDAILRDGQRDLAKLTTEAQRLMIEQEQIEQGLDGIGAFQNQLETTLSEVEEQVDAIFRAQGHLNPLDADKEREKAYETAKGIEYRLDNVTESLRETFQTLNQANLRTFGPPSSGDISGDHSAVATVGDIVHILNRHQDGLAELEAAAQKLELDCSEVHAVLSTTRH